MKALEFGGTVFNIRVVSGEVSVVDDDCLRRLRVVLPRGCGLRCRQLAGAKEPFQATDKPPFRRTTVRFEGEPIALEGEPVALEGGEHSDGGGRTADIP